MSKRPARTVAAINHSKTYAQIANEWLKITLWGGLCTQVTAHRAMSQFANTSERPTPLVNALCEQLVSWVFRMRRRERLLSLVSGQEARARSGLSGRDT